MASILIPSPAITTPPPPPPPPPPPHAIMSLTIRPATASDLPTIARISAEAFKSHPVDRRIHCHLDRYPDDFRRGESLHVCTLFRATGVHAFVACLAAPDGPDAVATAAAAAAATTSSAPRSALVEEEDEDIIVGVAMWVREGRDAVASKWRKTSFMSRLHFWRLAAQQQLFSRLDRSKSRAIEKHRNKAAISAVAVHQEGSVDFDRPDAEYWWLALLAVAPEAQRRTVGRQLARWGIDRAAEENVPVGAWAARCLVPFYERLGFEVVAVSLEGEDMEECRMVKMPGKR